MKLKNDRRWTRSCWRIGFWLFIFGWPGALISSQIGPDGIGRPSFPPPEQGPYFFFDDAVTVRLEHAEIVVGRPEKFVGNPIIPSLNPHVNLDLSSGPFTVLPIEESDGFRMWYVTYSRGQAGVHLGYGTSGDGIIWQLPRLSLVDFQGRRGNNLLLTFLIGGRVLLDSRAPKAEEKYKAVFYRHQPEPVGFSVAFSTDGLHWSPPAWISELDDRGENQGLGASDVVNAFMDPLRGEYVAVFKMWSLPGQFSIPVKRGIDAPRCGRRVVGLSRSRDFRKWSKARQILLPDGNDPDTLEFYGLQAVIKRGDLYLGFLPCLIDDAPPDGIGWTELVWSRDGENWRRMRRVFLERSFDKRGAPDQAIAWVSEVREIGGREFIYYSGCERGHKSGPRSGCLAFLPHNRFVSLKAGDEPAIAVTRPMDSSRLGKNALLVNADAAGGEVLVQALDAQGVLPGFSFGDCDPITSNGTAITVKWRGTAALPRSAGQLRLEFKFRNARLYAFSFQPF